MVVTGRALFVALIASTVFSARERKLSYKNTEQSISFHTSSSCSEAILPTYRWGGKDGMVECRYNHAVCTKIFKK